jgi:DnaJ-class molecular chaperone
MTPTPTTTKTRIETCGFCLGSGRVPGPKYDRLGNHRPEWPDQVSCEYCGGAGQCEEGSKLLPARKPTRDD